MLRFWKIAALGAVLGCLKLISAKVYPDWGKSSATVGLIIGGDFVTKPDLYPWHVALFIDGRYEAGGSLISESFVLTAAHVTIDPKNSLGISPQRFAIKAGIVKLDTANAPEYKVADVIRYPEYNQDTLFNDICLLRLSSKVTFGSAVRPIFLWDNQEADIATMVNEKLKGIVVGWGLTEGGRTNNLKSATLQIVTEDVCLDNVPNYKGFLVKDRSFCAIDAEQTVCRGDSGSALFLFDEIKQVYYLRGLVSQGVPSGHSCRQAKEALFTDIVYYHKWIEKIVLPQKYNLLGLKGCPEIITAETSRNVTHGIANLKYLFNQHLLVSDCHGVLITKKHVLSHASCVESIHNITLHSVSVGSSFINDYSASVRQYSIKAVNVSESLAIITLNDEVHETIPPVCLPARPEKGDLEVLFWRQRVRHPKKLQRVNVTGLVEEKVSAIQETLHVRIGGQGNRCRLGGAPLVYSIVDDTETHVYLRAVEKSVRYKCLDGETVDFVDVSTYRDWICEIVSACDDEENILPPRLE